MANINPPINPTNDPSYTGTTKPISIPDSIAPEGVKTNTIMPQGQQIGDKSAEYQGQAAAYGSQASGVAEKGFTDLFAGIVGIGDFLGKAGVQMVRKDIEDKVYQVADAERQRYTQQLEELKASGPVKNIMSGDGTDENGKPIPSDIQNLPDQLNVLGAARDGGKISSTDYQARLLAAAKDLRARYPGFKQEIDAEFSKVTGHNPANAYITGLVADINKANSGQNSERNKLLTYIMNNQGTIPNATELAQGVMEGRYGRLDVMNRAAPVVKLQADLAMRKAKFEDNKLSQADKVARGGELFDAGAEGVVTQFVNNFMTRYGLNTAQDAQSLADRTKSGQIGAKAWSAMGQDLAGLRIRLQQAIYNDARRQGLTGVLGQEEINKRTAAAMSRIDALQDRIYNHDSGGVFSVAQSIKAMGDDDQKRLLDDSKVGPSMRSIEVIKRIGGEQYLQDANLRQLTEGLSGKFGEYQKNWVNAIRAQANMETSGVPITLNDVFDDTKEKMVNATSAEKRKMNSDMINHITEIGDSKTPDAIKLNYAATAFSPGNRGFISRLNVDSVDAKGRQIQGQSAVFQKLTSPEMTKEMFRLGKSHPQVWTDYVNWASETLSNELIHREMTDLGQIKNPLIRVKWDADNKRLYTTYTDVNQSSGIGGSMVNPTRGATDPEYQHVQRIVNTINSNMANYKNIATAANANVDAFLLGTIAKAVGSQSVQRIDNIPGDIMRQIGLSKLKTQGQQVP